MSSNSDQFSQPEFSYEMMMIMAMMMILMITAIHAEVRYMYLFAPGLYISEPVIGSTVDNFTRKRLI